MRWKAKPTPKHKDTRVIKKFLLIPYCLENEWRWLEIAYILQQYCYYDYIAPMWVDLKFVEKGYKDG